LIVKLQGNRVYRSYKGGEHFNQFFGTTEQFENTFPEEWIASTVTANNPGRIVKNEGLSKTLDGKLLIDLISENPKAMLGAKQVERFGERMSILVKLLDCAERLVIQVHPTIEFAKKHFHSAFGKTECWYFLKTQEAASVYIGFQKGITRETWVNCFEKQDTEAMLHLMHQIPVKQGDVLFVEGGVPHAIGSGCFLLELQEPTDLMVIPERVTPSGRLLPEEKLHGGLGFQTMFDCFSYEGVSKEQIIEICKVPAIKRTDNVTELVGKNTTDQFQMLELSVAGNMQYSFFDSYAIAIIMEGTGTIGGVSTKQGDRLFLSADSGNMLWSGTFRALVCLP
jgi:Phosphomannose isomerase